MGVEVQILSADPTRAGLLAIAFERAGWSVSVEAGVESLVARHPRERPRVVVCDDAEQLVPLAEQLGDLGSIAAPLIGIADNVAPGAGVDVFGTPTFLL